MDLGWGVRRRIEVDVDGGPVGIAVEEAGPAPAGDGPAPVLALHGFASGTFTWAGVAPALSAVRRVAAWDRPPFGSSDRPPPGSGTGDPYGPRARTARARVLVDELGHGVAPVLMGHSAGALTAVEAVLDGQIDVVALVLVAPALEGSPPELVRRLAALPSSGWFGPAGLRMALRASGPALRAGGRHRSDLTDATSRAAAASLRRPGTAEALWHLTATWRPPAVMDRLDQLRCPVLVIGGEDDRIVARTHLDEIVERVGGTLHVLAGAGHAPQEQTPGAVAGLVAEFLDRRS